MRQRKQQPGLGRTIDYFRESRFETGERPAAVLARGGGAGLRQVKNLTRLQTSHGKRPHDDPGSLGSGNELVA